MIARLMFVLTVILTAACGRSDSSGTGAPAGPTIGRQPTTVRVGVAGNAPAQVVAGTTLQLWAVAEYSDRTSADITNLATWQTWNEALATVQPGGVLKAVAPGMVKVTATYLDRPATLEAEVQAPSCAQATLAPPSLTFDPRGRYSCFVDSQCGYTLVITALDSCTLTAQSDVSWLNFAPGETASAPTSGPRSAREPLTYFLKPNNYPSPRTGRVTVTIDGGPTLVHTVTQERPLCSIVLNPETAFFPSGGGSGSVEVTATPADCEWTARAPGDLTLTGSTSGNGTGTVTYTAHPNPFTTTTNRPQIIIEGPNPTDPRATHRVTVARP